MNDIRAALSRLTPVPGDTPSERLDVLRDRLTSLQDPVVRARHFVGGVADSDFSPAMLDVGLAFQARRVAPGAVEAAIRRGPPRLARPGGATCVISAGNLPLITASDVVWSLLAGDRVVVKVSHRERVMTPAFVEMFADHAAAGWWPHDDDVTERTVFEWADHLLVYGSDDTIAAIRERRAGAMQGFGHRVSFAWVSADALRELDPADLADRIAIDVALWDQEGCLSPHAVLVEAGEAGAADVAARLARALGRLERALPRGDISFETRLASRALTLATEARMLSRSAVGAWSGENGAWSVLLDPEPDTLLSPLGRTIRVVPVSGRREVEATLAPYRNRVQSLGVAGRADDDVLGLARSLGATRVCSLGRMQQPTASWFGEERSNANEPLAIDVDVDVDAGADGAWRWLRGEEAPPWFRMPS